MSETEKHQALREARFCQQVLAKSGDTVLSATLRETDTLEEWKHVPAGDAFDPESGAQWYYHCHPKQAGIAEHGHFHCFVRPNGKDGPVHHLIALGVDAYGNLIRLFTVNQWVVGDAWLDAAGTVALLPRFDLQLGRPSYLVNRWLTAIVRYYADDIALLIGQRDIAIAAQSAEDAALARQDRGLEVTSQLTVKLPVPATAAPHDMPDSSGAI